MTYFITAKQIVEYEAESERPTSKKERTTNGKKKTSTLYSLEIEIHSTRKRRTLNACERVCNKPNGSVNLKRDHPLWVFALPRRTLTHCWVFGIKCFRWGGKSIVEFYIFSALQWESLRYCGVWQIFMRHLGNCGLEFWYCGISKHAEVFVIGWAIFSMVVSNFSVSLCSVTVFRIPLAALQSFCACVYFCHKTSFDSVILCPVAVLERLTKQYSHDNLLCVWTHQQK